MVFSEVMLGGLSSKQFIGSIFLLAFVGIAYYGPFGKQKKVPPAYLVGEYKSEKTKGKATLIAEDGHILRRWPVPFSVHKVVHNNSNPWQILALEKSGEHMALIDARVRTDVKPLMAPEGLIFSGHGVFSTHGDRIFITAQDGKTAEGFILVYDSSSGSMTGKMSSEGFAPHDLQYDLTDSKNLIAINTGAPSQKGSLVWISEETGKVVTKVSTDDPTVLLKHFLQTQNDIYLYGGSVRHNDQPAIPSFGVLSRKDRTIKMRDWPKKNPKWNGDILNAYHDSIHEKIWLTLPLGDVVLVLDAKTLEVTNDFATSKPASLFATPLENPQLLMISVSSLDGDGMQKAFDLKNVSGSDAALENPRKFYSEHATPLEVAVQDY